MNELQKKLARRRDLNGEGGDVPVAPASTNSTAPNSSAAPRSCTGNTVSAAPVAIPQGMSELQAKLQRRKLKNGEMPAGSTADMVDPSDPPLGPSLQQTSGVFVSTDGKTASSGNKKDSCAAGLSAPPSIRAKNESEDINLKTEDEVPSAITAAECWSDGAVETPPSNDNHQEIEQGRGSMIPVLVIDATAISGAEIKADETKEDSVGREVLAEEPSTEASAPATVLESNRAPDSQVLIAEEPVSTALFVSAVEESPSGRTFHSDDVTSAAAPATIRATDDSFDNESLKVEREEEEEESEPQTENVTEIADQREGVKLGKNKDSFCDVSSTAPAVDGGESHHSSSPRVSHEIDELSAALDDVPTPLVSVSSPALNSRHSNSLQISTPTRVTPPPEFQSTSNMKTGRHASSALSSAVDHQLSRRNTEPVMSSQEVMTSMENSGSGKKAGKNRWYPGKFVGLGSWSSKKNSPSTTPRPSTGERGLEASGAMSILNNIEIEQILAENQGLKANIKLVMEENEGLKSVVEQQAIKIKQLKEKIASDGESKSEVDKMIEPPQATVTEKIEVSALSTVAANPVSRSLQLSGGVSLSEDEEKELFREQRAKSARLTTIVVKGELGIGLDLIKSKITGEALVAGLKEFGNGQVNPAKVSNPAVLPGDYLVGVGQMMGDFKSVVEHLRGAAKGPVTLVLERPPTGTIERRGSAVFSVQAVQTRKSPEHISGVMNNGGSDGASRPVSQNHSYLLNRPLITSVGFGTESLLDGDEEEEEGGGLFENDDAAGAGSTRGKNWKKHRSIRGGKPLAEAQNQKLESQFADELSNVGSAVGVGESGAQQTRRASDAIFMPGEGSTEEFDLDLLLRSKSEASSVARTSSEGYNPRELNFGNNILASSFTTTGKARDEVFNVSEKLDSHGLFGEGNQGLFGEVEEVTRKKKEAPVVDIDYREFLARFTKCTELLKGTRQFLFSILGPNGDMRPPPNPKKVDYIFYGGQHLDNRCRDFFDNMQEKCRIHPEFKDENEERQIIIRDRLEQYVMSRIADCAFQSVAVDEVREQDELLSKRMKILDFLTAEALDIKPDLINETLLEIARDELRRINSFKTPWDKISCVVKSADIIFRSLNLSRAKRDAHFDRTGQEDGGSSAAAAAANGDASAGYGADDFLPLFIWVVLRSHAANLASNCEFIYKFLNPVRQMGKAGYYLTNLQSAINFVNYVEADSLSIDPEVFNRKIAEAESNMADV